VVLIGPAAVEPGPPIRLAFSLPHGIGAPDGG
jgi:hypothetical protein